MIKSQRRRVAMVVKVVGEFFRMKPEAARAGHQEDQCHEYRDEPWHAVHLKILGNVFELCNRGLHACCAIPCDAFQAVIKVVMDHHLFSSAHSFLHSVQLLGDVNAAPLGFDHGNHVLQMSRGTLQPFDDIRMSSVDVFGQMFVAHYRILPPRIAYSQRIPAQD